ncbi:hypothetical protein ABH14_16975 [Brevibacillus brevis]|uniref:YopX family protein n=1 Tax=Brevibacillus brevis TaxID=1393 RepID=UPI001901EFC0|nr:YopX family protein [Brevibacillus brevis]MBH0331468.1 hypothetical protein [Brevibacillus brevis]
MQAGRKIKFRAWDQEDKTMLYDIQRNNQFSFHAPEFDYFLNHSVFKVMQFTGLRDKNGKEIYEGDLILSETYGYPIAIYWHDGDTGFYCHDHKGDEDDHLSMAEALSSEVIGNIYESPELLEVAERASRT